jgi:MoaA/NifB/PqqE/SkfB family radical SAM enzyme
MPLTIGIQLTTRCNLRCTHCYVSSNNDDAPLATLRKVADGAHGLGSADLHFTGGEPTLHPRFPEIVDILRHRGLRFTLVSNAWNFGAFRAQLLRYPEVLGCIAFSLDGAVAEVHDGNRGAGSYERVVAAASFCRREQIPFGFRMTLTRANLSQIRGVAHLAERLGATDLALLPLMPTRRTAERGYLLSPGDLSHIVTEAHTLRRRVGPRIVLTAGYFTTDPLRPCPAFAGESMFITSRGAISVCCHLADYADGEGSDDIVADLRDVSLAEAASRVRKRVACVAQEKAQKVKAHSLGFLDHHPCWYCLKRFGKVNWMRSFPDTDWGRDMINAQNASVPHPCSDSRKADVRSACAQQLPGY